MVVADVRPDPTLESVTQALRQQSQGLSDGSRLPTVRDLMKQFSVGQGVIQRAIAELSREGLLSAEVGRGTFVRRQAPTPRSSGERSVVILNHDRPGVRGELIATKLHEQLLAAGTRSVVMTYSDLAHAGEWLAAMPSVDACVVRLQGDVMPAGILATLRARCKAVVIEGVPVEHVDVDSVATDWLLAIETAIRHLQSRGHRKIALALNAADTRFAREGARLFRSLMRTAGDEEPVVAYRTEVGYDLAGATAVVAWSIAVAQQLPPGTPMVMMENPDIGSELPGVTIVGRTSARIATAVIERIDFRLNNPDAAFAPVYDKPKLVIG